MWRCKENVGLWGKSGRAVDALAGAVLRRREHAVAKDAARARRRVLASSLLLPPLRITTFKARDQLLEAVAVALELLHERRGIRTLRGNWGDTRATRGRFWSAFGRGDGVDGAPTGRGALLRDARRPDAARFWHAVQLMDTLLGTPPRHKKNETTNRAPPRPQPRPPPPHRACPRPPVQLTYSPPLNHDSQYRSTAAKVKFSAGRRGCRRAPR